MTEDPTLVAPLAILVGAPFVAALLLVLMPSRWRLMTRLVSLAGALVSLALSVRVALAYDLRAGGFQLEESYPVVPSLGIELTLALDGWGVSLLLLTGLIIVAGVLATWTLRERDQEFYILLLVLVAGVFGVFVCQDLFLFFLFYEIAVLPMYILIGIWGSPGKVEARGPFRFVWKILDVGGREYAAMKLTLMLLVGSALILVVMLTLYFEAGGESFDLGYLEGHGFTRQVQLWAFPLCWLGFGSLAGVFPFHTWSPDGHAAAPTAVSMLHAGVLMKLGAFGVIRVGMVLMPEGAAAWAPIVGAVAVVNIVYGALAAMGQKDLKYIVAYSSVSHMGVVMLGAATLTIDGWNGAIYQMFAHGMMTGLFFALVGLVYERAHTRQLPEMGGFAKRTPGLAVFFTLACLSSLGLPGTAGFIAELLVFLGAWQSAHSWWAIPGILGAFVTAVYVLRASKTIFWGPGPAPEHETIEDARGVEWLALWILGAAILLFGLWPSLVLDFIDVATSEKLPKLLGALAPLGGH
ncbi:MAG: NADH-quinone oxidoreductase subunit M [Myxococcales bacterium]|nr:NADH-quinone oxidoreductase subunit M [Myxococcales bacterium]